MKIADIFVVIFFVLPGYLAWEIANLIAPYRFNRSETQRLSANIAVGMFVLITTSILEQKKPSVFVRQLASADYTISWLTFYNVVTVTCLSASFMALWRIGLYDWIQGLLNRARRIPYRGEKTVWDMARFHINQPEGRLVTVHTTDGWVYNGHMDELSSALGDRDILLRTYWYGKQQEDGIPYHFIQPDKPVSKR